MINETYENKIVSFLLALYCVLLPFEEALASSFGSILRIIGIILIGYILLVSIRQNKLFINRYQSPLVLWILYMGISVVWVSSFTWWSYFFRIYIVQIVFVCVMELLPIESINIKKMEGALIAGGCIASAILILLPTASGLTDEGRRTIMLLGTVLDPNIVASIIILGAQISLAKFYTKDRHSLFYFILLTWQFLGILLTGSRGALIAFAAGFVVELFFKLKEKGDRKKAIGIAILGAVGIVAVLAILPENLLETRFSKETILGLNELQSGSHNRYTIWMYALKLIRNNPIFGYGCGNFFSAIATVYKTCASHNLYILMLVECGVIGLMMLLAYIHKLLRDLFREKDYSTFALLFTVMVMALTLDSIAYKYFWIALIYARLKIRNYEFGSTV